MYVRWWYTLIMDDEGNVIKYFETKGISLEDIILEIKILSHSKN